MFWTKSRTVLGCTAMLALSGLVFSPLALAKPRDEGEAGRGRPGNRGREVAAERPIAQQPVATAPATPGGQAAPAAPSKPDRVYRAGPVGPWQPGTGQTRGVAPSGGVRETPVSEGGKGLARQPYVKRGNESGQTERANPYRIYQAPERQNVPEERQRVYRPQPADDGKARRVDDGQTQRVQPPRGVLERPQGEPGTRAGQGRERERVRGEEPKAYQPEPRDRDRIREQERPTRPEPQGREDRAYRVPKADFRGPEADRDVRIVKRENQERLQSRLRERVQEQNRLVVRPERKAPAYDIVGNAVSSDTTLVLREHVSRINVSYTRVRRAFGEPSYFYLIAPRSRLDYWDGYWDGYVDGHWAGKHYRHGPNVVINFYYGYYWSDPYWFAFYYPGYYPSVYHYWGWCPGWVYPDRVYYVPTDYTYFPATPYRYYNTGYRVDELAAQRVIEDVRKAWFNSDISSLAYHLTDEVDIRVYFDGEYSYSTTTEDYYAMTVDAMATTETVALDFDRAIWLSSNEVFVTGRHVFWDPSEQRQTIYVSYRFRNLGGEWYLVAVGSSLDPIRHSYRDFRY